MKKTNEEKRVTPYEAVLFLTELLNHFIRSETDIWPRDPRVIFHELLEETRDHFDDMREVMRALHRKEIAPLDAHCDMLRIISIIEDKYHEKIFKVENLVGGLRSLGYEINRIVKRVEWQAGEHNKVRS